MKNNIRILPLTIALLSLTGAWSMNLPAAQALPKKAAEKIAAKPVHKPTTEQSSGMGSVDSTMFEAATGGAHRDESVDQIAQTRTASDDKSPSQGEAATNIAANIGSLVFFVIVIGLVSTCGSAGVCAIVYNVGNAVRGSKPSIG